MKKIILVIMVILNSLSVLAEPIFISRSKNAVQGAFAKLGGFLTTLGPTGTKVVDFFVFFALLTSFSLIGLRAWAGENHTRSANVIGITFGFALSLALVWSGKLTVKNLFPVAGVFIILAVFILFFKLFQSMGANGIWSFILALITTVLLVGFLYGWGDLANNFGESLTETFEGSTSPSLVVEEEFESGSTTPSEIILDDELQSNSDLMWAFINRENKNHGYKRKTVNSFFSLNKDLPSEYIMAVSAWESGWAVANKKSEYITKGNNLFGIHAKKGEEGYPCEGTTCKKYSSQIGSVNGFVSKMYNQNTITLKNGSKGNYRSYVDSYKNHKDVFKLVKDVQQLYNQEDPNWANGIINIIQRYYDFLKSNPQVTLTPEQDEKDDGFSGWELGGGVGGLIAIILLVLFIRKRNENGSETEESDIIKEIEDEENKEHKILGKIKQLLKEKQKKIKDLETIDEINKVIKDIPSLKNIENIRDKKLQKNVNEFKVQFIKKQGKDFFNNLDRLSHQSNERKEIEKINLNIKNLIKEDISLISKEERKSENLLKISKLSKEKLNKYFDKESIKQIHKLNELEESKLKELLDKYVPKQKKIAEQLNNKFKQDNVALKSYPIPKLIEFFNDEIKLLEEYFNTFLEKFEATKEIEKIIEKKEEAVEELHKIDNLPEEYIKKELTKEKPRTINENKEIKQNKREELEHKKYIEGEIVSEPEISKSRSKIEGTVIDGEFERIEAEKINKIEVQQFLKERKEEEKTQKFLPINRKRVNLFKHVRNEFRTISREKVFEHLEEQFYHIKNRIYKKIMWYGLKKFNYEILKDYKELTWLYSIAKSNFWNVPNFGMKAEETLIKNRIKELDMQLKRKNYDRVAYLTDTNFNKTYFRIILREALIVESKAVTRDFLELIEDKKQKFRNIFEESNKKDVKKLKKLTAEIEVLKQVIERIKINTKYPLLNSEQQEKLQLKFENIAHLYPEELIIGLSKLFNIKIKLQSDEVFYSLINKWIGLRGTIPIRRNVNNKNQLEIIKTFNNEKVNNRLREV